MAPSSGYNHVQLDSFKYSYSPMVTAKVGPDLKQFVLHKDLVCQRSNYFTKTFPGSFLEENTGIVELEDVSPVLFKVFVAWLYYDRLVYTTTEERTTIKNDFEPLLFGPTPINEEEGGSAEDRSDEDPPFDPQEDPATWSLDILARLYALGDRVDSNIFKVVVIDTMISLVAIDGYVPSISLIQYA